ncbi:hypothetical protein [Streptomyces sp. SAJ15]|uniref:hypothetical protein n=1 Tax=Streptomyces sp. SAJ15 TaxID=2011095 RepID=UPI001184F721|nr:hypothetical protein [Streptomyces sp. SAJ15]
MSLAFQIALGRARVAVMVAGLAWFVGLDPPWWLRLMIAALVVASLIFDGAIDDQRITRAVLDTKPPPVAASPPPTAHATTH